LLQGGNSSRTALHVLTAVMAVLTMGVFGFNSHRINASCAPTEQIAAAAARGAAALLRRQQLRCRPCNLTSSYSSALRPRRSQSAGCSLACAALPSAFRRHCKHSHLRH
jgi:hypothetical protein